MISNTLPQNYKFTGKERDSETGLDDFGARFYSSGFGRFMTPDWAARATAVPYAVFGDPQSLNLYGYVRNDPVSRADADGHQDDANKKTAHPQCGSGPACPGASNTEQQQVQGEHAQAQGQKDNLKKEVEGIQADQERWNSFVKPLIELIGTALAFVEGGEAEEPVSPETSIESPEETVVGGGKRTFSAADRADALEGAKDTAGVPRCQYCGNELTTESGKPNSYEADHTVPYSRGGKSTRDNLTPACRSCNRSKGAQTPDEWLNQ